MSTQSAAIQSIPNPNYFDDSRVPGDSFGQNVAVRTGSLSTSAMQRLGQRVETVTVTTGSGDSTEFGTGNLGTVTIPGATNARQIRDASRQGTEVKIIDQFDAGTTPLMRFSQDPLNTSGTSLINFDAKPEAYGQPKLFADPDPNDPNVAKSGFEDIALISPITLVNGGYGESMAYPIVQDNLTYLDPASQNGRIDVFDTVRTFSNTLISDGLDSKGAKGNISGGGLNNLKGTELITHHIELHQSSEVDFFEDAQNVLFQEETYNLVSGSISLPGLISEGYYHVKPYDDSVNYEKNSYFNFDQKENLIFGVDVKGPYTNMSEIGTRFKSTTNGLIFGESNVLGTDSIAFGGLKK